MKRHKSLVPLSHDHHRGLLLAQLIKRGAPEYKGLPNDKEGKVRYTLDAYQNELALHFKNEEEILFPAAKGKDEKLDKLIDKIIFEHNIIVKLVSALNQQENIIDKLDELGKTLEAHIRKEERELFPLIENSLSEYELSDLESKIKRVKNECDI